MRLRDSPEEFGGRVPWWVQETAAEQIRIRRRVPLRPAGDVIEHLAEKREKELLVGVDEVWLRQKREEIGRVRVAVQWDGWHR